MTKCNHDVEFYGLTTCVHCRRMRDFLEKNQVPFVLYYVDKAEGEERARLLDALRKYNPATSFPTLVLDHGKEVIVGCRLEETAKALDL